MGIEDNNIVDRALDAAEEKLTAVDATEDTQAEPVETHDLPTEAALVKNYNDKTRDDAGKFTKGKAIKAKASRPAKEEETDLSDQATDVEEVEADPTEEESSEAEPIDIPAFWPADLKALAAEAPPEIVKKFIERDVQREQWARRSVAEAEPAKAIATRLYNGFEAVKDEALLNGINNPVDEVERYRAWDNIFKRNPGLALIDLGRKNNITPEAYAQMYYGGELEAEPQSDPRIEEAFSMAQRAQQELEQYKQQSVVQTATHEVEAFKNGKDSTGQTRRAFVEMYAPQIAEVHDRIRAENPHLPLGEVLHKSYEYVVGQARKAFGVSGKAPARTQSKEQIMANAKKAQAIASSANGAPASGKAAARSGAKSVDEAIDRAEERLGVR